MPPRARAITHKRFRPWAAELYWMLGLLALTALALAFGALHTGIEREVRSTWILIPFALIYASRLYRRVRVRWRGQRVEACAVRSLRAELMGATLTTGIWVPGIGDVDASVSYPDGRRYAIEIKSYTHFKHALHGAASRAGAARDPVRQVRREACATRARPVLWCPAATDAWYTHEEVLIVQGSAQFLAKLLNEAPV